MRGLDNKLIFDADGAPGIEASSPELGVSTGLSKAPENKWAPEVYDYKCLTAPVRENTFD